jgi:hypothetical protein
MVQGIDGRGTGAPPHPDEALYYKHMTSGQNGAATLDGPKPLLLDSSPGLMLLGGKAAWFEATFDENKLVRKIGHQKPKQPLIKKKSKFLV